MPLSFLETCAYYLMITFTYFLHRRLVHLHSFLAHNCPHGFVGLIVEPTRDSLAHGMQLVEAPEDGDDGSSSLRV